MSYIKQYETFEEKCFDQLLLNDWNIFIKNIIDVDVSKFLKFPYEYEIKKTVNNMNGSLMSTVNYIFFKLKNHDKTIFIYELNDEYYGIYAPAIQHFKDIRLKCDQVNGVIQGLKFIEDYFSTESAIKKRGR